MYIIQNEQRMKINVQKLPSVSDVYLMQFFLFYIFILFCISHLIYAIKILAKHTVSSDASFNQKEIIQ